MSRGSNVKSSSCTNIWPSGKSTHEIFKFPLKRLRNSAFEVGNCWCRAASLDNYKAHRKSGRRGTKQRRGRVRAGPGDEARPACMEKRTCKVCRAEVGSRAQQSPPSLVRIKGSARRLGQSPVRGTLGEFHFFKCCPPVQQSSPYETVWASPAVPLDHFIVTAC